MTRYKKLSGAAATSHARKLLDDARKDGAQITISHQRFTCDCGETATCGTFEGPTSEVRAYTCLACGYDVWVGTPGYRFGSETPEDKKRDWLYGARAEQVKIETRSLFTVTL